MAEENTENGIVGDEASGEETIKELERQIESFTRLLEKALVEEKRHRGTDQYRQRLGSLKAKLDDAKRKLEEGEALTP